MSDLFFKGIELINLRKFKGKVFMACPHCSRTRRMDKFATYETDTELGRCKYYKCGHCKRTIAYEIQLRGEVHSIKIEGRISG